MERNAPPPPAGWYPDPGGGPVRKYWDGAAWHDALPTTPGVPVPPRKRDRKLLLGIAAVVLGLMAIGNLNHSAKQRGDDAETTAGAGITTTTSSALPSVPRLSPDEMKDAEYSAMLIQRGVQFTAAQRDDLILQAHVVCVFLKQPAQPSMMEAGAGLMKTYGHDATDAAAITTSAVEVYCPDMKP